MTAFSTLTVGSLDARVVPHRWAWAEREGEAIRRHWDAALARSPAMFDGRIFMMRDGEGGGDPYRATFFETRFSAYLAWRDLGRTDPSVRNGFSMAALQASDGGWILGVMGDHTSNPGHIYFPSGTPDPADVVDGTVDLAGSVLRELEEETGLRPSDVTVEPRWHVAACGARTAFLRPVRVDAPAGEVVRRIEAHLAAEDRPELSGVRVVRRLADLDPVRMPDFLIHWFGSVLEE